MRPIVHTPSSITTTTTTPRADPTQGLPPAGEFWAAAVAARCSAIVCLGHDETHVAGFFAPPPAATASGAAAAAPPCCRCNAAADGAAAAAAQPPSAATTNTAAAAASAPHGGEASSPSIPIGGGRSVRVVHRRDDAAAGLIVRQVEVAAPDGAGERWINFLHLRSWPDAGVPASPAGLLRLCQELDAARRPGWRIAVQCCCGTDAALGSCPAGAFVAADVLRQRLLQLQLAPAGAVRASDARAALDVKQLVRALRAQRPGLVETPQQFAFVHAAAEEELKAALRAERRLMPRAAAAAVAAAAEAPSSPASAGPAAVAAME